MKAVILIGGLGTRLRPLTDTMPKSMVPVVNRPAIEHTMICLRESGVKDIILTLNYLPDVIRSFLGDGSGLGVNIIYCLEEEPLGTAGALKNTEKYLDDGPLLVMNGDIFTDLNIGKMLDFHRQHGAVATISLNWVEDPSAFGVVEMDGQNRVGAFIEKPPREEATTNWINGGTYILEREVLDYIPGNSHYMFERGLFPALLEMGKPVYGFTHKGYWLDMGRPAQYYRLNMDILSGKYECRSWPYAEDEGTVTGSGTRIDPSSVISGHVVIGEDTRIGPGVRISGPAVIGSRCRIAEGVSVSSSVIWDDVEIGEKASVNMAVIASGTAVDAGRNLKKEVVTSGTTVSLDF